MIYMAQRSNTRLNVKTFDRNPPDHIGVLSAAVLMAVGGFGGLYLLVTTSRPFVGQRWLFLLLLHIAVTGFVIPFVRFLNVRFTRLNRPLPSGGVIVRQSVWIGVVVMACAWLQMLRVLTPINAFFIALAFVVIEVFLRSREIAHEREND